MNKKIVLVLIPVLVIVLLLFARNRVLFPSSAPLPLLLSLNGLQPSGRSGSPLQSVSFDKTIQNKRYTVKLAILPIPWGQVVPNSSSDVQKAVSDDVKNLNRLLPKQGNKIFEQREFAFKGKPGCVYILTSQTKEGESYSKILDFVQSGSLYRLSSNVRGGVISTQEKEEVNKSFQMYLAELQKEVK